MSKRPSESPKSKTHCPQGHAYDEVGFYVIKSDPRGDYRRCKKCHADRERKRLQKLRDANPKPPKNPYAAEGEKQCFVCGEVKPFEAFHVNRARSDGRESRCKECLKRRRQQKQAMNTEIFANPSLFTDEHRKAFDSLIDDVGDRLDVILWDLSERRSVNVLASGLSKDGGVIHFFSDEWVNRQRQCAGFIRAHAGLFRRKVGARSCEVREVLREEAKDFLEAFHIQGANHLGVIYFGIYHLGDLVGIMSLGRHSRQISQNRIVLDRLCFKAGVQVVGGPSKLLKAAVAWAKAQPYDEVVTFSDNRWTNGALYALLGFELEQDLRPDYSYVRKDGRRFSKQSQKKGATGCPEGMTELEWATARGLRRIYDAGKKRWMLNLRPGEHKTRNERSSKRCAEQHQEGVFKHSHIRGYFESKKCGCGVYYSSSYELRCLFLLEDDDQVASFRRCEAFKGDDGWRNPDLWVDFVDGRSEVWEIKPKGMLSSEDVQKQIEDSKRFSLSKGVVFRVWTEDDSGLDSDGKIVKWATEYLKGKGEVYHSEHYKNVRKKIRQRHYKKMQADKVKVECAFCNETHEVMRLTYDRNEKKNGRFICIRENGYLVGKMSKKHLKKTNPYAAEGKSSAVRVVRSGRSRTSRRIGGPTMARIHDAKRAARRRGVLRRGRKKLLETPRAHAHVPTRANRGTQKVRISHYPISRALTTKGRDGWRSRTRCSSDLLTWLVSRWTDRGHE